jgi:ABC-type nitrate/sulfonate/bicarbonate transport system permease component
MRRIIPPVLLILAIIVLWQGAVMIFSIPKWLLPSPYDIVLALIGTASIIGPHMRQTIIETGLGLLASLIFGVGFAVLVDFSEVIKKALYPLLVASQTIPIIAIAPLLIIWFGYGIMPKIIVVALICFFPITVNMADGLRSADPDLILLLKSMGASRFQIFSKIRLPGSLPSFFSGLKVAITYSVIAAIIGEWVGASKGLGIFMIRSAHSFFTDRVFAAILITSLLSILMFLFVEIIERTSLPWYYASRQEIIWREVKGR